MIRNKVLEEMKRQIEKLGYRCEPAIDKNQYAHIYYGDEKRCILFENGALSTNGFSDISVAVSSVKEYMDAYEKAEELKAEGLREGYRKLLEYNGYVLAMKEMDNGKDFEFVTWQYSFDGKAVNIGRYFNDYKNAKENMAFRSGLVDLSKMFSETELKLIHTSLVNYVGLNSNMDYKHEKAIGSILEKIGVIVPEIQRHEELENLDLVSDDGLEL